jgi:Flp pilus assembly protein TadD
MNALPPAAPQPAGSEGSRAPFIAGVFLLLGILGVWAYRGGFRSLFLPHSSDSTSQAASDDPRLTYPSPYRNVRPEVRYVGDAVCAECHADIAASFALHPMGQSMAPMTEAAAHERYEPKLHNPFEAQGFNYQVRRDGDRIIHSESFPDGKGGTLAGTEADVTYRIGSGARGHTYVVNRNGYLYESPISWYTQKAIWDLSPGYAKDNLHFDRAIAGECLFCHCNQVEPVPYTVNHYREPLFRGHAIGCERCHGPGELHVRQDNHGDGTRDLTIVNPRHLEPALREAVCQQCHLQGSGRILRAGRGQFDYRPGLPLHLFLSTFIRTPELTENEKAVSHVEQMYVSRCFRQSGGKLGCISCHDPHRLPAAAEKVSYYRKKCLECHKEHDCSESLTVRRKKDDSCYACHMNHHGSEIPHTSSTDHRILRRPDSVPALEGLFPPAMPGLTFVSYFHHDQVAPGDPDVSRDLGLALLQMAREANRLTGEVGAMVAPLLGQAVVRRPDDVPAWEGYGWSLVLEDRLDEALTAFESGAARAPDAEVLLAAAAHCAGKTGRPATAVDYARRAVAANPYNSDVRFQLALLLLKQENPAAAREQCQAILRLNPAHAKARMLLATCWKREGHPDAGQTELDKLRAMNPGEAERLRRWLAEQGP